MNVTNIIIAILNYISRAWLNLTMFMIEKRNGMKRGNVLLPCGGSMGRGHLGDECSIMVLNSERIFTEKLPNEKQA